MLPCKKRKPEAAKIELQWEHGTYCKNHKDGKAQYGVTWQNIGILSVNKLKRLELDIFSQSCCLLLKTQKTKEWCSFHYQEGSRKSSTWCNAISEQITSIRLHREPLNYPGLCSNKTDWKEEKVHEFYKQVKFEINKNAGKTCCLWLETRMPKLETARKKV